MVDITTDPSTADADADSSRRTRNSTSTPPKRPVDMAARGVCIMSEEWPGLPRGVKFDPSDEELLGHLIAKIGKGEAKPHPLISEFITSLDEDDRFGYTHPQTLAGVKQDGSASFFFHRRFKEGARKDKMIHNSDSGVVWWHKIGKTVPVTIDGVHQGCKKMMNLYLSMKEGDRAEKTNWVMFQYYLGRGGESEEEFVVSKIFHQGNSEAVSKEANAAANPTSCKRKIRAKDIHVDLNSLKSSSQAPANQSRGDETHTHTECEELDNSDIHRNEDPQGGEIERLDLQQHVESIVTNEDLYQAQPSCSARAERRESQTPDNALIGVRHLKDEPRKRRKLEVSTQHSDADLEMDYSTEFIRQEMFRSREEMSKWVRDTARSHGFVIVIKSSVSDPDKKPRVTYGCERGGTYRVRNKGKTNTTSKFTGTKKCDCPFSLKGKKLPDDDDWMLVVECGVHNHPATDQLSGHSYAGRLTQEETSLLVEMCNNSVPARSILSTLKQRDPLNVTTIRTIYNARSRYKSTLKLKKPQIQQVEYTESQIQQLEDYGSQIQQLEDYGSQIQQLEDYESDNQQPEDNESEYQQLEQECRAAPASSPNSSNC